VRFSAVRKCEPLILLVGYDGGMRFNQRCWWERCALRTLLMGYV